MSASQARNDAARFARQALPVADPAGALVMAQLATAHAVLALVDQLAQPKAEEKSSPAGAGATPELTIYRAGFDGHDIPLGLYRTPEAARAHCEAYARREYPAGSELGMAWSVDEDDPNIVELDVEIDGRTESTGYIVTAVPVASEYDEGAEE